MGEKCYSLRDAAALIGIKVRTMRQWVHNGKIEAFHFAGSRRWFIKESEIVKKIDAMREKDEDED